MPETTIKFDPEAKGFIPEIFTSREELLAACERAPSVHILSDLYSAWAKERHVADQSIATTAYDPMFMRSRLLKHGSQMGRTDIGRDLPESLKKVFEKIPAGSDVNVLFDSTTPWTMYFDLRAAFPDLKIHATCAMPTEEYANKFNAHALIMKSDLNTDLVYKSDWQNGQYDVVSSDYSVIYKSTSELKEYTQKIAATNARTVVFSNVMVNTGEGPEQHRAQRTRDPNGGIVPIRVPAKGELTTLMNDMGYMASAETQEKSNLPQEKYSVVRGQAPLWDHFTYTK